MVTGHDLLNQKGLHHLRRMQICKYYFIDVMLDPDFSRTTVDISIEEISEEIISVEDILYHPPLKCPPLK